jgi:dephospho-CoA kinase
MQVIALTGLPRSGKDTAAKYLAKKYGYTHFDFYRHALVPELKKLGLKVSKENATRLGVAMREKLGNGAPAKVLVRKLGQKKKIIVTGFRSPEEVSVIKQAADQFILAEVKADRKLRFKRRKKGEGRTLKDFLKREKTEASKMGVKRVLKMAKVKIKNAGTLKDLKKNLDAFMARQGLA